ncbi:MAG: hypothetical protein HXS47_00545 [Theionarchaea archaeon]|nr:hypothetical protein [Theionarchaea archaeon]
MKIGSLLFIIGICIIVIAALLFIGGDVLGPRTSEVAAFTGIIGILIIGFSSRMREEKSLF